MNTNKDLIIFLAPGKLYLSDDNRILQFEIPSSAVKDLDVVNKSSLQDTLNAFLAANKIEPSAITFVISETACFSKDIYISDQAKIDSEATQFLDAVPFNYLASKVYKIGQGARVIAVNRDLVDSIYEVFETKGFPLFAIVPAAIFPQEGTKRELDSEFAKVIGGSGDIIRGGNMITPKPIAPEIAAATAGPPITTNKASSGFLPYLIGVAALMIIILVALIILRK